VFADLAKPHPRTVGFGFGDALYCDEAAGTVCEAAGSMLTALVEAMSFPICDGSEHQHTAAGIEGQLLLPLIKEKKW